MMKAFSAMIGHDLPVFLRDMRNTYDATSLHESMNFYARLMMHINYVEFHVDADNKSLWVIPELPPTYVPNTEFTPDQVREIIHNYTIKMSSRHVDRLFQTNLVFRDDMKPADIVSYLGVGFGHLFIIDPVGSKDPNWRARSNILYKILGLTSKPNTGRIGPGEALLHSSRWSVAPFKENVTIYLMHVNMPNYSSEGSRKYEGDMRNAIINTTQAISFANTRGVNYILAPCDMYAYDIHNNGDPRTDDAYSVLAEGMFYSIWSPAAAKNHVILNFARDPVNFSLIRKNSGPNSSNIQ